MEGSKILKRSSLLSFLLLVAIVFVTTMTYQLWHEAPQGLPKPGKGNTSFVEQPREKPRRTRIADTANIISKNLFDPERGAGTTKESKASSVAAGLVQNMVLLGTAILGNTRYAILQEPSNSRRPDPGPQIREPGLLRLKLGDTVQGFNLSEINEESVVFTKGPSRLELPLDFSRRVEEAKQKTKRPTPARPRPTPRTPRRGAVPSGAP